MLRRVMRGTIHLELEIEIDSDPISGSVQAGNADACRFTGWIELVAAIEEARAQQHESAGKAWGAPLVRSGSEGS